MNAEALAAVERWAAEGSPHRARALAVLTHARAALGDRAGALRAAEVLAAERDPAASVEGHVAWFHLLLASARQSPEGYAEAARALWALERVAPGSEEAAWARHALTIEAGTEVAGVAPMVAEGAAPSAKAGEAETGAGGMRLSVWPNPALGAATVGIALPQDVNAEVVVYDAQGRRVAVLHEGDDGGGGSPAICRGSRAPGGDVPRESAARRDGADADADGAPMRDSGLCRRPRLCVGGGAHRSRLGVPSPRSLMLGERRTVGLARAPLR